jgi:HK97 family phage prohead protease
MLAIDDPTLARVFAPRTTIAADGTVEGYASLFGEIDQARDMVMAGAFRQSLLLRGVRRIPMLFQHDPAEPIGIWQELVEDSRGLYARGRLIPDVQRGREVLALVKAGAIDGLSIGFKTVQGRVDPRTRIRRLTQVDLWEISIVTFPLLTGARVRAVEQAGVTAHGQGDRHERLFRRHPRFSFVRTRAEAEWKAIFRGELGNESAESAARASNPAPAVVTGGSRLERVQQRSQTQPSRRERRIRGWIADSALRAMADRKALLARPSR